MLAVPERRQTLPLSPAVPLCALLVLSPRDSVTSSLGCGAGFQHLSLAGGFPGMLPGRPSCCCVYYSNQPGSFCCDICIQYSDLLVGVPFTEGTTTRALPAFNTL